MKNIKMTLDPNSIQKARNEISRYRNSLEPKLNEICRRLASMGATYASLDYSRATYMGNKNITVSVEPKGNGYVIIADGESVLFVEFGAGIRYGAGHPLAGQFGYGPGTYPPTDPKHPKWDSPTGWYIPGGEHTYGNPPSMTMYNTVKEIKNAIQSVAQEVFAKG